MPAKRKNEIYKHFFEKRPRAIIRCGLPSEISKKCSKKFFFKMAGTKVNLPFDAGQFYARMTPGRICAILSINWERCSRTEEERLI